MDLSTTDGGHGIRRLPDLRGRSMNEAEWQEQIIGTARDHEGVAIRLGWHVLHLRPGATSRGRWSVPVSGDMGKGWPDLILARPPRIIAVELKAGKRQPTPEQIAVLDILSGCGVETYIWRPEEWDGIVSILR